MPVFDFSGAAEEIKQGECTYTIVRSNEMSASPEKPILVLDEQEETVEPPFLRIFY